MGRRSRVDGDVMAELVMRSAASCRSCGHRFTFAQAWDRMKELEVDDDEVILCPGCLTVYALEIRDGKLKLLGNVTNRYPRVLEAARYRSPKRWWQFWK